MPVPIVTSGNKPPYCLQRLTCHGCDSVFNKNAMPILLRAGPDLLGQLVFAICGPLYTGKIHSAPNV